MKKAFTLIELLVVIAIIAILSVVVILTLNPAELLRQSRDTNRISDMTTLNSALTLFSVNSSAANALGQGSTIYISVPDPTATSTAGDQCQGLGLPSLPNGYVWRCSATSTYRNVNGTGWIPVNFSSLSSGAPFGSLPVDPTNTSSSGEFYAYSASGTVWEIASTPESQKYSTQPSSFVAGTNVALIPSFSATTTLTYTSNGTWTEPVDLSYVVVQVEGAGGGGGSGGNAYSAGGGGGSSAFGNLVVADGGGGGGSWSGCVGGGGGGATGGAGAGGDCSGYSGSGGGGAAYATKTITAASLSASEAIVVGQGGEAAGSGSLGGSGYFNGGNSIGYLAGGGGGGATGNGANAASSGTGGAGGAGASVGDSTSAGSAGTPGVFGSGAGVPGGAAGGPIGGAGGASTTIGGFPGGGGGSGSSTLAGAGAGGEVIVTEYISVNL